jgi:hypothetical protein
MARKARKSMKGGVFAADDENPRRVAARVVGNSMLTD